MHLPESAPVSEESNTPSLGTGQETIRLKHGKTKLPTRSSEIADARRDPGANQPRRTGCSGSWCRRSSSEVGLMGEDAYIYFDEMNSGYTTNASQLNGEPCAFGWLEYTRCDWEPEFAYSFMDSFFFYTSFCTALAIKVCEELYRTLQFWGLMIVLPFIFRSMGFRPQDTISIYELLTNILPFFTSKRYISSLLTLRRMHYLRKKKPEDAKVW